MAGLLGFDPAKIIQYFEQGTNFIATKIGEATAEIKCLVEDLAKIRRILSYEYGQASLDIDGYDPLKNPFVLTITIAPGGNPQTVDLMANLGKRASRGHIMNTGTNPATLVFVKKTANTENRSGQYLLPPNTTLEISWAAEVIQVSDTGGGASVQFFAQ